MTATFLRWHRYEDEDGVVFADQRDNFYDASSNRHHSTCYEQVQAGGRTRYQICTIGHPRFGQRFDVIDYSPNETFDRTITGCRCLDLTGGDAGSCG